MVEAQRHLKELKLRTAYSSATFIITWTIAFLNKEKLWKILTNSLTEKNIDFIFTNITEAFTSYCHISTITAVTFTIPILIFNLYLFVRPGCFSYEEQELKLTIYLSIILFEISIIFLVTFIAPYIYYFFIGFQTEEIILQAKMNEFIEFFKNMYLMQIFLVLIPIILTHLKIGESINIYTKNRKYFVLIVLLLSALVTPPDVLSQVTLTLIIISFTEIIIMLESLKKMYGNKSHTPIIKK